MKRLFAGLMAASCAVMVTPMVASAKVCSFCNTEIDPEIAELNCPNCDEIAKRITAENSQIWVLDFQAGKLEHVQIKDDTGDTQVFWILPYTITNRDAHPHEYFLDIDAFSDRSRHGHTRKQDLTSYYTDAETGQPRAKLRGTYRYHDSWVPDVYDEARKILGVREGEQLLNQRDVAMPPPGQQNVPPALGREEPVADTAKVALPMIQPGETQRCVAIFKAWDPQMDVLSIFVRGLTNSSLMLEGVIRDEDYVRPPERPGERDIKEAVLVLTYERDGDEFAATSDPLRFVGRRWTDQPRTIKSDLRSKPSDTVDDNN